MKGVDVTSRDWSFKRDFISISDRVEGSGKHLVVRSFCTCLDVRESENSLVLFNNKISFRLFFDEQSTFNLQDGQCWNAYGDGVKAKFIKISFFGNLPWCGNIIIKKE